ncbi:hypothetical protein AGR6A_Lc80032 [Agrobacterium sp. NCPPB 925]|nr:hypothetical protein AGR6A_Lc80032 [Agrobacterium sp. NCPPB 925]
MLGNYFPYSHKALQARGPTASLTLRASQYDETAAMVYDKQPISDYFRRISENELAGMMVVRGDERRYFFSLKRIPVSPSGKNDPALPLSSNQSGALPPRITRKRLSAVTC